MNTGKKVAIAIAVIVILIVVAYAVIHVSAPAYDPNAFWCSGGAYSDGVPVLQAAGQVGMSVCGGGNRMFKCTPTGWALTGATCPAGSSHMV